MSVLKFVCNICGQSNHLAEQEFGRELAFCSACGSNARFRGIIHALTTGLLGRPTVLRSLPHMPLLTGIGFSDAACYAQLLASRFGYVNTFYDTEPRLDITDEASSASFLPADFVICSEVFEHIQQPLDQAFRNLVGLVKPGGLLVFSVPTISGPDDVEHFPRFYQARTIALGDEYVLVNRTADGEVEIYRNPCFCGGPGKTLEMRVFSHHRVIKRLQKAGFHDIQVFDRPIPEIGYCWSPWEATGAAPGTALGYVISVRSRPATALTSTRMARSKWSGGIRLPGPRVNGGGRPAAVSVPEFRFVV